MKSIDYSPFSKTQRQLRVGELLRKEIADILIKNDFHNCFLNKISVTVSQVVVTPDMKWARTFVTSLGGENIQETMNGLNKNVYRIQKLVASKIKLRRMPKIIFLEDKTFDYANKLTNKIKNLN
ncbi:MAG: ribosome-binding factor A [SAR116 cluster bacterium]|nr:ribosome-binding factor A [SAR116 cluster bacterium]